MSELSVEGEISNKIKLLKDMISKLSTDDPLYRTLCCNLDMVLQTEEMWNKKSEKEKDKFRQHLKRKAEFTAVKKQLESALENNDTDKAVELLELHNFRNETITLHLNDENINVLTVLKKYQISTLSLRLQCVNLESLYDMVKSSLIKTLDLTTCKIDDAVMTALCDALKSSELTSLVLNYNDISDVGAISLSKTDSKLKLVNLVKNNIGVDGAKALGEYLTVNNVLEDLILSGNPLGDDGFYQIMEGLKHNKTLKMIGLMDVQVTNIDNLIEMLACNNTVESVYLCNNKLCNEQLNRLYEAYVLNETVVCIDIYDCTEDKQITDKFVELCEKRCAVNPAAMGLAT